MIGFVLETAKYLVAFAKDVLIGYMGYIENPFLAACRAVPAWVGRLMSLDDINGYLLEGERWLAYPAVDGLEISRVPVLAVNELVNNLNDGMYRSDPVYLKKLIQYCDRGM